MNYVRRKIALERLGICYKTLYKMAKNNKIDTIIIENHMFYNVEKYIREQQKDKTIKYNICYCRVSSLKQKRRFK